jgi:3-oxoacyl-[acyl-carrier-protein] synthase-3
MLDIKQLREHPKEIEKKLYKLCLSGFGVGLTWAAMVIDIGPLEFCEQIDY